MHISFPDLRSFLLYLPPYGISLGPSDLGHLLGVGCTVDVDANSTAPLSRGDRALLDCRRARSWSARGCHPFAGWCDQSADHQVLGRLVEYAAPARLRVQYWRLEDRSGVAYATPYHGSRLYAAIRDSPPRKHA